MFKYANLTGSGLGHPRGEIPASQDVSYESQAKMLSAFLDARSLKQVDLIGNDTGGGVSQITRAAWECCRLTQVEVHDAQSSQR